MPSSRSILGIDLRVTSVKVVEIEKDKDRTILKNWGLTEIPYSLIDKHPQKEDAQAEALRKLVQTRKIKTREAAVVVGGGDVHVKVYSLPETSKIEAAELIKWKIAEEIPFPVEEALIDFYPLPKGEGSNEKLDYVSACINKKLYREIAYIIRKAGLKLKAITVIPDVLGKLFESGVLKEKGKTLSLIYMGKRTTNISILKNGRLEFNRELNIGGENITLAMSGVLVSPEGRVEINPEEAEKIKVEHGVPVTVERYPKLAEIPITQLQAMVRPALERIQDEVMRTFEYYKGQTGEAAIDKIILTGGSSMTLNLVDFLSEALGIPVVTLDAMLGREYDESLTDRPALEKVLPRLSAAIGAALVGEEKINLMPEEVKYYWKLIAQKVLKPQYLILAFVAILLVTYFSCWLYASSLKGKLDGIEKKLEEYKPQIAILEAIEKSAKEEEKRKLTLMTYEQKTTKMPVVFEEISRIIPRSIFINVLYLTPEDLKMWGTVFEREDTAENILSRFILALSDSPYFGEVRLLQAVKNTDYEKDAFNFEIIAQLKF